MSDKTTNDFHQAKSDLESALEDFLSAAEKDDRNLKDELLEAISNTFGIKFTEELTGYQ